MLILDGEELVGAKQNRIVNLTILVAPRSEIVIPVSCIEAGRWGYSRPGFAAAGRVLNQEIRYCKAVAVTKNLKERRVRFSDQRAVWNGVSKALFALGAASPTSALSDGFDSRANAIDDFVEALRPLPEQIGVVYRIGGVVAGLDLSVPRKPSLARFLSWFVVRRCRHSQASRRRVALHSTTVSS